MKGWRCPFPTCGKPINSAALVNYKISWPVANVGRWRITGNCPHRNRRLLFTKHGTRVIGEIPPPAPAPVPMRHEIVVRRRRVR